MNELSRFWDENIENTFIMHRGDSKNDQDVLEMQQMWLDGADDDVEIDLTYMSGKHSSHSMSFDSKNKGKPKSTNKTKQTCLVF